MTTPTDLLPGELRLISRLPILMPELIVDVGSSFGEYSERVGEVCPGAVILPFDPQSGTPAIGDKDGVLELVCFPTSPTRASGVKAYTDKVSGLKVPKTVQLRRLDTLLPGRQIDFLKVDVEGMEWEVLQGLGSLPHPRLVQFEYSWASGFAGVSWNHFLDLFHSWNYVMRELDFVGDTNAINSYYNYVAGPYALVQQFF